MPWKDLNTGRVTDYYPPNGNSGSSSIIHVPDEGMLTSQNHTGMPDTFAMGQAIEADPRFRRFMKWCFVSVAVALALLVSVGLVETEWARLMKWDQARSADKPTVWSANTTKWSPARLFHLGGPAFEIGGADGSVDGDVNGLNIDAFSTSRCGAT